MLILSMGLSGIPEAPVAAWEFNSPGEVQPWRANSHMSHVLAENGILACDTIDWDPFFTYSEAQLATSPTQFVVLRIRASKAGKGSFSGPPKRRASMAGSTRRR